MFRRVLAVAVVAVAASVVAPTAAHAQGLFGETRYEHATGRIRLELQVDGKTTPLTTADLKPTLDAVWGLLQRTGETEFKKVMEHRKFGPVSVYEVTPHIAAYTLEAKQMAGGVVVKLRATGNSIRFKSTTPDVKVGPLGKVGLPSGADPKIHLGFTVEAEVKLSVVGRAVAAQVLSAQVLDVKSHGANATGWLAHAVVDAVKFFGGPDVRGLLRAAVDRHVNAKLKPQLPSFGKDFGSKLPAGARAISPSLAVRKGEIVITFAYSTKPEKEYIIK